MRFGLGGVTMISKDDWRWTNQMNYLFQAKLRHKSYTQRNDNWDHDHCSFCFDEFNSPQQTGYCTLDEYHWICETCFSDFHEIFEWDVQT